MTEHTAGPMIDHATPAETPADVPLVLHVIPTTVARGAQREARALADRLDRPGVRSHRVLSLFDGPAEVTADISLHYRGGRAAGTGLSPGLVVRLRSALARFDPTVVVAHGSEPLKYLVPAMAGRHRPLVYYAIGTYSGGPGRFQLRLWQTLMARADVVAAEGHEVLDEVVTRLGVPEARAVLAPNGRDPELFHPRGPDAPGPEPAEPEPPRVVFVGALTPGKRPDLFIDLVARLRADGVGVRAELIGDDPLRGELADAARSAGVEMRGPRADVADQLRRADVMVFTSDAAGEGMPGVLIEAGLSGLPVVATDVPGVRSIVADGDTGVIVAVGDPDGLAAATTRLVGDPGLRAALGRAARQRCLDRFSLAAVEERWLSFLQPLVDAGADPTVHRPPRRPRIDSGGMTTPDHRA